MKKEEFLKKYNLETNLQAIQDLVELLTGKAMQKGSHFIKEEDIKVSKSL